MAVDVELFSKETIYRASLPCTQVLEDLQRMGKLDAIKEKQQGRAFNVGCGTLVAATLLLFVGFVVVEDFELSVVMLWSGGGLALVGIVAFILRSRYERLNLENRRYELVSHTVGLLQADISPDEPVTLELDLRPETHSDKYKNDSRTRSGWNVKHYLDPWLSLQGRLLDGTHFSLEMTERIQMRKRTKTTPRGKTKFQNKRKSDALLRLRLRVKPERYQHLARIGSQAEGAMQILKGTRLKDLSVDPDRIDLTLVVDSAWRAGDAPSSQPQTHGPPELNGVRVVAMAFLSLYQLLNLSRALDKKAMHPPTG
ncbi:hypothetical protein ACN28E_12950 [Archangium lansingense]|uniref:hypothetical protein n=1 Tax=Archangium lansingense TaxID=2995310 RepID=UPI003B8141C9